MEDEKKRLPKLTAMDLNVIVDVFIAHRSNIASRWDEAGRTRIENKIKEILSGIEFEIQVDHPIALHVGPYR